MVYGGGRDRIRDSPTMVDAGDITGKEGSFVPQLGITFKANDGQAYAYRAGRLTRKRHIKWRNERKPRINPLNRADPGR